LRWLDAQPPDLLEVRQALGRIVNDGNRAADVIDRIRALIKKAPPRSDRVQINESIGEVIGLTHGELVKQDILVQTQLASELPLIQGDRVQLQQVIINFNLIIGVIRKNVRIEGLARAIRGGARGEVQLSAAEARLLVDGVQETAEPERLTARELDVLQMISDGLANKEIAWKLRISEKTVKKHVSTILDKFGLQSRTQAALHAWRFGLARPERAHLGEMPLGSIEAAQPLRFRSVIGEPA